MLIAYAAILFAYTAEIVFTRQLPKGLLGWMVIGFTTTGAGSRTASGPPRLPELPAPMRKDKIEQHTRLAVSLMQGTRNGRILEMTAVAADERPPRGEEKRGPVREDPGGGRRQAQPRSIGCPPSNRGGRRPVLGGRRAQADGVSAR